MRDLSAVMAFVLAVIASVAVNGCSGSELTRQKSTPAAPPLSESENSGAPANPAAAGAVDLVQRLSFTLRSARLSPEERDEVERRVAAGADARTIYRDMLERWLGRPAWRNLLSSYVYVGDMPPAERLFAGHISRALDRTDGRW